MSNERTDEAVLQTRRKVPSLTHSGLREEVDQACRAFRHGDPEKQSWRYEAAYPCRLHTPLSLSGFIADCRRLPVVGWGGGLSTRLLFSASRPDGVVSKALTRGEEVAQLSSTVTVKLRREALTRWLILMASLFMTPPSTSCQYPWLYLTLVHLMTH